MLQIKELTITYKKDLRNLISGLSFVLNPGDKAAIIGEEGNGKSTLMKLLYDERLVEDYAEYSGEILQNNSVLGYLTGLRPRRSRQSSGESRPCRTHGAGACPSVSP